MSKFRVHKGVVQSVDSVLCAIEDRIVQRLAAGMSEKQKASQLKSLQDQAHAIVAKSVKVDLKNPQHLYGYHGDMREETAHVVIPREVVNQYMSGGASNDVGFTKTKDGFDAIVSEYDRGCWWDQSSDRFWQAAATFEAREAAIMQGYAVETVEDVKTGTIQLICTSY